MRADYVIPISAGYAWQRRVAILTGGGGKQITSHKEAISIFIFRVLEQSSSSGRHSLRKIVHYDSTCTGT